MESKRGLLFVLNIFIEEIIAENFDGTRGVSTGERKIQCLRFMDYILILSEFKTCWMF